MAITSSTFVIVVQENRSFDNLFATYPNADGQTRGKNSAGQWIQLRSEKLYSRLALRIAALRLKSTTIKEQWMVGTWFT
jgi:hypothetical protein